MTAALIVTLVLLAVSIWINVRLLRAARLYLRLFQESVTLGQHLVDGWKRTLLVANPSWTKPTVQPETRH